MADSPDHVQPVGRSRPVEPERADDTPPVAANPLLFRRYEVLRELGRGGMGVVMLVHDNALDIPVAMKLVPELVVKDQEAMADLRREVLRGMALNHDGIVRTHNFERDDTTAGIVMEYIEGITLADYRASQSGGCFEPEEVLPILEQLCPVLDYAHQSARIVHRDLKPRNIMLARSGRLKVADFGTAAVICETMSRHSGDGKFSGTPNYMSPQQAEGKRPSSLDDMHALGATIYELLTGKPPFFGGTASTVIAQIFSITPPSMMERREELGITGRRPLPELWEEVVAACLAKDPKLRPKSAGEVLSRLGHVALPATARSFLPPETATRRAPRAELTESIIPTVREPLAPQPVPPPAAPAPSAPPMSTSHSVGWVAVVIVFLAALIIAAAAYFGGVPKYGAPAAVPASHAAP